jgi:hypothetical protein
MFIVEAAVFTMKLFHPVNSLVASRNLWLILLSKIRLFLYLVKHTSNILGFQICAYFSLGLVLVTLLAFL